MSSSKETQGRLLLFTGSLLGAIVATVDYVTPSTGIDHSYGVLLVLVSSLLMAFGSLIMLSAESRLVVNIIAIAVLFDIIGTGFASYMLESDLLMVAMVIATAGWILGLASARGF